MKNSTPLTLTLDQRQELERMIHAGTHAARKQTRARILLLLDRSHNKGRTNADIAELLGCHVKTVGNIRRRFLTEGLQATLTDKPMGPTSPRKMTGELEAHLVVLALSDAPEGYSHWTMRLLADKAVELGFVEQISHVTVAQMLKKTKSNPGVCKRGASASLLLLT